MYRIHFRLLYTWVASHLSQNIPCTFRTTGSLYSSLSSPSRKPSTHVTYVVLYVSVARTRKEDVCAPPIVVIFGSFSSDNKDPLTIQPIIPTLALQLKIALEFNVALTDVGVLVKAEI